MTWDTSQKQNKNNQKGDITVAAHHHNAKYQSLNINSLLL